MVQLGKNLLPGIIYITILLNSFTASGMSNDKIPVDTVLKGYDEFFANIFKTNPGKFDSIILHRIGWNAQLIYTQADWGNNGFPVLQQHYFNKNDGYFYPATALKLPIALLALQKLHELPFPGINMNTSMITESGYSGQRAQYNDPNTADGRPTIAQYIREMLLGNDLNAFDRLYEFLGQQYINEQLAAKGYKTAQVLQRLSESLAEDENRHTNPVSFYNKPIKRPIYQQPMQYNNAVYEKRNDFIGTAYMTDTGIVHAPMDFSRMNRISLDDLNNIMISILFPSKLKPAQRFNITEEDRRFILKYMSQLPAESTYPYYDSSNEDIPSKYIFYGGRKDGFSKSIRVFNISGMDSGQLTDIAYVVDFENKTAFLLAATIYCNKDGIQNDEKYDYESIGIPFMRDIGKAVYDYELKRKRSNAPDLSSLIFTYDK